MPKRRKMKRKGKKGMSEGYLKKAKDLLVKNNPWEVKIDVLKECGKSPKEIIIWVLPLAKLKIDFLMEKMGNSEWLAYLIGNKENYLVEDIWIPEQEVSSTRVDNVNCPEFNSLGVIGVMHSHHSMGNNFSGTDDNWINQNHDISLCISDKGIKGHVRWKTPCGGLKFIPAILKLKFDVVFDECDFKKTINERIKKKTYQNFGHIGGYVNGYPVYKKPPLNEEEWCKRKEVDNEEEKTLIEELSTSFDGMSVEDELQSWYDEIEGENEYGC